MKISRLVDLAVLSMRLDAVEERLDARRKAKPAPGQLGLFTEEGNGVKCGDGWINRDFECHKGNGGQESEQDKPQKPNYELDVSTDEKRAAFIDELREYSISGPKARFNSDDLGSMLLTLCDRPGLAGENAKKCANYLYNSGILVTIDKAYDPLVKSNDLKHYLSEENIAKLRKVDKTSVNMLRQVQDAEAEYLSVKAKMTNPKVSSAERVSHIASYGTAKKNLETLLRSVAPDLLGMPEALGIASVRQRTIKIRDDVLRDNPYNPKFKMIPHVLQAGIELQLLDRKAGLPGTYTLSEQAKLQNHRVLSTFIHEIGHFVQFDADDKDFSPLLSGELAAKIEKKYMIPLPPTGPWPKLEALAALVDKDQKNSVSTYALHNQLEYFAETFTAYVIAPDALKRYSPLAYDHVNNIFDYVLEGQKTNRIQDPVIFSEGRS